MDIPLPIAANCLASSGLVGGASLGALSLLAAIERVETPPEPRDVMLVEPLCELVGLLYREPVDPEALMLLESDWLCECPRDGEAGFTGDGAPSAEGMDEEKGTTPARWAISCSPRRQCIASTARQGITSSSATLDHISALNLCRTTSAIFHA